MVTNLINPHNLAQNSWSKNGNFENEEMEFKLVLEYSLGYIDKVPMNEISHPFDFRSTYKPWKNALLRYSKYAGAQSKNICNSVREIHLITKRSSAVRAKLAPLFPPLAAHE